MGAISGVWLLALVMFTNPEGPPAVTVQFYASEASCREDLTKSMNDAFNLVAGHADVSGTCYFVPRRIGS